MFTYWSTDGSSWQCWTKRKLGPRWSCINTTDPSRFWSSEVQVGICMRCCDFSKGRHFFRGFKSHMQTAANRYLPQPLSCGLGCHRSSGVNSAFSKSPWEWWSLPGNICRASHYQSNTQTLKRRWTHLWMVHVFCGPCDLMSTCLPRLGAVVLLHTAASGVPRGCRWGRVRGGTCLLSGSVRPHAPSCFNVSVNIH